MAAKGEKCVFCGASQVIDGSCGKCGKSHVGLASAGNALTKLARSPIYLVALISSVLSLALILSAAFYTGFGELLLLHLFQAIPIFASDAEAYAAYFTPPMVVNVILLICALLPGVLSTAGLLSIYKNPRKPSGFLLLQAASIVALVFAALLLAAVLVVLFLVWLWFGAYVNLSAVYLAAAAVVVLLVLAIVYFARTLASVSTIKRAAVTDLPYYRVSVFAAALGFLFALLSLLPCCFPIIWQALSPFFCLLLLINAVFLTTTSTLLLIYRKQIKPQANPQS